MASNCLANCDTFKSVICHSFCLVCKNENFKKIETMELCLLCENELGKEPFVENPTEEAINNLLFRARERHKFRDNAVENFVSQTADKTAVDLINLKVRYHRKCYSDYANISKLERQRSGIMMQLKLVIPR